MSMIKVFWQHFLLNAIGRRSRYNRQHYPAMAVFAHDFIGAQIYVNGRYEHDELEALRSVIEPLVRGGTILDVGANIGNHALYFSELAQEVHCFEPNPRTAALLQFNTADYAAVTVHNFGLSAEDAILEAFVPAANAGGATLGANPGGDGKNVTFHLKRFDDLPLAKRPISAVKIDVEGHEADAFEGMRAMLQRDYPLVLFECNRKTERVAADAATSTLQNIGFDAFYSLKPSASVIPDTVPALLRRPARFFELALRKSMRVIKLSQVTSFENSNYPLILAVKTGSQQHSRLDKMSQ